VTELAHIVVLHSGGLDSTVALAKAIEVYGADNVTSLGVMYGSKHNKEEDAAANRIAADMSVARVVAQLPLDGIFQSNLLKSGGPIPEGHYADESMKSTVVPFRNGLLLSLAAGYAESIEAKEVWYAAHGGDHPIYPDCRPEFFTAMAEAVHTGTDGAVRIHAPYMDSDKAGIVREGARLYVPMNQTWSCYQPSYKTGRAVQCGKCGTCVERIEAFAVAEVRDATAYAA